MMISLILFCHHSIILHSAIPGILHSVILLLCTLYPFLAFSTLPRHDMEQWDAVAQKDGTPSCLKGAGSVAAHDECSPPC